MADRAGFENRSAADVTRDEKNTSDEPAERLGVLLGASDPDLALIVERWDTLAEAVRTGILAMVRASAPVGQARGTTR